MGKIRVGQILKENITGFKSSNRSEDLIALHKRFDIFSKKLKALVEAVQAHNKELERMNETRSAVATAFADVARDTPFAAAVSLMPAQGESLTSVCSYLSVHNLLSETTKEYVAKHSKFIVDYLVEWESVITKRVLEGKKLSEELRRELDHYETKVTSLRSNVEQLNQKGRLTPATIAEKLKRNEEKLQKAQDSYVALVSECCTYLEETVDRGWRDLYPVMVKVAQFDVTLSGDESDILASLGVVEDRVKEIAAVHRIPFESRLPELAAANPEELSTEQGEVSTYAILHEAPQPLPQNEDSTYQEEPVVEGHAVPFDEELEFFGSP